MWGVDKLFESHLNTGRPLGSDSFIKKAEQLLRRGLFTLAIALN